MSRSLLVALLVPTLAHAGVAYTVTQKDLAQPAAAATVTEYFVQDGNVRVGAIDAKTAYIFKGGVLYVIDNTRRSAQVLTGTTLRGVRANLQQSVQRMQGAAATSAPDKRAMAERIAAAMAAVSKRQLQPPPTDYAVTDRSESVDGHACRVWEEREGGTKRVEFCVAPIQSVPGGGESSQGSKCSVSTTKGRCLRWGSDLGWRIHGLPSRNSTVSRSSSENTGTEARSARPGCHTCGLGYRRDPCSMCRRAIRYRKAPSTRWQALYTGQERQHFSREATAGRSDYPVTPMTADPIVIPYSELSAEALRAVVESFVLREGTDYGLRQYSFDEKVAQVMEQLRRGEAWILFDADTESVTIAPEGLRPQRRIE